MKRLLIATNCKSMVIGQMRRLGWNPDAIKGILWIEDSPAVETFFAASPQPKKSMVRLTTQFYTGSGLKGPDDKALAMLDKFESVSMDEGMRWLQLTEKSE